MTIDQGPDTARYQGIVALEGNDLECAAHEYFLRSEQIPTCVRLAVAQELRPGGAAVRWRAGELCCSFCRSRRNVQAAAICILATCRKAWCSMNRRRMMPG